MHFLPPPPATPPRPPRRQTVEVKCKHRSQVTIQNAGTLITRMLMTTSVGERVKSTLSMHTPLRPSLTCLVLEAVTLACWRCGPGGQEESVWCPTIQYQEVLRYWELDCLGDGEAEARTQRSSRIENGITVVRCSRGPGCHIPFRASRLAHPGGRKRKSAKEGVKR